MNPSSLSSMCVPGTPAADGAACDADGMAGTRDICRSESCVASTCGDGFVDTGASPAEECDDGNTMDGDGCDSACQIEAVPPTAMRITQARLISPRAVFRPLLTCSDITDPPGALGLSVNGELASALDPADGYSLHMVNVFQPLAPGSASTPLDVHLNAACTAGTPDSCMPDASPEVVMTMANNRSSGACFTPDPSLVNTSVGTPSAYSPGVNSPNGPCFVTPTQSITITLDVSGTPLPITLEDALIAAEYDGTPTSGLVNGVITGFMSETVAADTVVTLPVIGARSLYSLLQAGGRSVMDSSGATIDSGCNVGGGPVEDDADMNGSVRGFYFFLNFQAEIVDWTP